MDQPEAADPAESAETGMESTGVGVWTVSPHRENVMISPDAFSPLRVDETASTGRGFPEVATKRVV
jgi:hypothetical protein